MQVKSNGPLTTEQDLLQTATRNLSTFGRLSRDCAFLRNSGFGTKGGEKHVKLEDQRRLLFRIPEVMVERKG